MAFPLILGTVVGLLSCFSGVSGAEVIYFGTRGDGSKGIYRAHFDPEEGKLSGVRLAAEMDSPGFLALHPDGDILYAVARRDREGILAAFRVHDDGSLTSLRTLPIPGRGPVHLACHPTEPFLLTAQYGGGSVALFSLDPEGVPQAVAQQIQHEGGSRVVERRQSAAHPHWVGYSPDGRFAFVPDLGLDQIVCYRVVSEEGSGSRLEPAGAIAAIPGGGPRHMRFSPDGRWIFLIDELALSVSTFSYGPETGAGKRVSTTAALPEDVKVKEPFHSGSEVVVHPGGHFVYSANRGHDSITVFRWEADRKKLVPVEVEPIRGAWPRHISLDSTGRWLLAAGAHSNTVAVFAVDPESGELTYHRDRVVNVPGPICILPTGKAKRSD